jgi:hypothetical protein
MKPIRPIRVGTGEVAGFWAGGAGVESHPPRRLTASKNVQVSAKTLHRRRPGFGVTSASPLVGIA